MFSTDLLFMIAVGIFVLWGLLTGLNLRGDRKLPWISAVCISISGLGLSIFLEIGSKSWDSTFMAISILANALVLILSGYIFSYRASE